MRAASGRDFAPGRRRRLSGRVAGARRGGRGASPRVPVRDSRFPARCVYEPLSASNLHVTAAASRLHRARLLPCADPSQRRDGDPEQRLAPPASSQASHRAARAFRSRSSTHSSCKSPRDPRAGASGRGLPDRGRSAAAADCACARPARDGARPGGGGGRRGRQGARPAERTGGPQTALGGVAARRGDACPRSQRLRRLSQEEPQQHEAICLENENRADCGSVAC